MTFPDALDTFNANLIQVDTNGIINRQGKPVFIQLPPCKLVSVRGFMLVVRIMRRQDATKNVLDVVDDKILKEYKESRHLKSLEDNHQFRMFTSHTSIMHDIHGKVVTEYFPGTWLRVIVSPKYVWNGHKCVGVHWSVVKLREHDIDTIQFLPEPTASSAPIVPRVVALPPPPPPPLRNCGDPLPPPPTITPGGPPPPPPPPPSKPLFKPPQPLIIKKSNKSQQNKSEAYKPPTLGDIINMRGMLKSAPKNDKPKKEPEVSLNDDTKDDPTPFGVFKKRLISVFAN